MNKIASDYNGVSPMTGPTGLVLAIRSKDRLIPNDVAGVQPMTPPHGTIFTIRSNYFQSTSPVIPTAMSQANPPMSINDVLDGLVKLGHPMSEVMQMYQDLKAIMNIDAEQEMRAVYVREVMRQAGDQRLNAPLGNL
jgi:hypothetical protein